MSRPDFDAIAEQVSPEQLARAIGARPSRQAGEFHCPGPSHENGDKNPSMSLGRKDGRTVGCCHGGCDIKGTPVQVAAAVWGLSLGDAAERLVSELGISTATSNGSGTGLGELIATYDYTDEQGDYLFSVRRYALPKDFRQGQRQGAQGWKWGVKDVRRVLYRLPEVAAGVEAERHILIVEGEKDADELARREFIATTCPGGAGKWRAEYSESLKGANVCILPDNDKSGRGHAQAVAQALHGIASEVRILELPDLPEKGDVPDWLESGGTDEELQQLVTDAPVWEPIHNVHLNNAERDESNNVGKPFPGPITAAHLMEQPEPEVQWLAEGLIPAGGNVLIAGYPKSYKTTFVEDLAVSLASGTPCLEKFAVDETHHVGVILMEGMEWQAARRIRRLCRAKGEDPRDVGKRIHIWHRPPLKLTTQNVLGLAQWIEKLAIDVVILDSWSYVGIGNSNDSDEVTPQLQAFSSIRDTVPGCTTLLVHHARKSKEGGGSRLTDEIRNSGAFGAWYDAGLVLSRKDEQSPVAVRCELRDYPSPEPFTFTVEDEHPATESNGWRSSGYLRLTATDKSIEQIERDARIDDVLPLVRDFVAANDGCSKRALREGVKARGEDVDRAWKHLVRAGEGTEIAPSGAFKAAKLSLGVPVSHGVPDADVSQRVPVSPTPPKGGGITGRADGSIESYH